MSQNLLLLRHPDVQSHIWATPPTTPEESPEHTSPTDITPLSAMRRRRRQFAQGAMFAETRLRKRVLVRPLRKANDEI